jgi:hypothetical protein
MYTPTSSRPIHVEGGRGGGGREYLRDHNRHTRTPGVHVAQHLRHTESMYHNKYYYHSKIYKELGYVLLPDCCREGTIHESISRLAVHSPDIVCAVVFICEWREARGESRGKSGDDVGR